MEDTALGALPVLLVDCQATGASPTHGSLLDVAWCLMRADDLRGVRIAQEHLDIEGTLVGLPDGETVPRRVQKITGISTSMVAEAPSRDAVREALTEAITTMDHALPVAHYARYERPFFEQLWPEDHEVAPFICTHKIAKRLMPGLPRRGLRAMAGYFGEVLPEHKRSEVHVLATALIWRELVELLVEEEGIATLGELRHWLATTKPDRNAERHFPLKREIRLSLPKTPGVYRMLSKREEVLYVGKATSLKQRVNSYFRGKKGDGPRKLEMATQVWDLDVTECASPLEAALLETDEIKRLAPPYNQKLRRGDRQVWFASPDDFTDVVASPDADHLVGPFSTRVHLDALTMMCGALREDAAALALLWKLEDESVFLEGMERWRTRHDLASGEVPSTEAMRAMGLVLWDAYLEEKRRRAEARAEDAEATQDEDDDDEEASPDEPEWSAQGVADAFDKIIRRVTRQVRRGAFVAALGDAALCWRRPHQPEAPRRLIILKTGVIDHTRAIEDGEEIPWPALPERDEAEALGLVADVATYDRLSVFAAELRRLARDAPDMELHLGDGRVLDAAGLAEVLAMI